MERELLNLQSGVQLETLVKLFYRDLQKLGAFEKVASSQLSENFNQLLNHDSHMTIAVESYHGTPVDVKVLDVRHDDDFYSRKILLTRQSDEAVVQYGIVTLNKRMMDTHVFEQIMAQGVPLGRILIENNVLREVHRHQLYRVTAGDELSRYFAVPPGTEIAGRTAVIDCDGQPAIGLLEIVVE